MVGDYGECREGEGEDCGDDWNLSASGYDFKVVIRTSEGESAIDVIPPCSVYATPAEEDQEADGDCSLQYAQEVEST